MVKESSLLYIFHLSRQVLLAHYPKKINKRGKGTKWQSESSKYLFLMIASCSIITRWKPIAIKKYLCIQIFSGIRSSTIINTCRSHYNCSFSMKSSRGSTIRDEQNIDDSLYFPIIYWNQHDLTVFFVVATEAYTISSSFILSGRQLRSLAVARQPMGGISIH